MRRSVSSPDETLRRELKIRLAAEYFWRTTRCFLWWWNIVSNAWYCSSNKMILEGEIKDAKWAVSHPVSKYSLINFLRVFFNELLLSLRRNSDCMSYGKLCRKKICALGEFLEKNDWRRAVLKISQKSDKYLFVCYLNFFFCEYKTKNSESASYAEIAVWKKKEKNKQPKAKNTQQ